MLNLQGDTKKEKKTKPKQEKEERKTGLIDKKMYFKYWNLSFGFLTFPMILIMVAGAQTVKILQEEEALTWSVFYTLYIKYIIHLYIYTLAGAQTVKILRKKRL